MSLLDDARRLADTEYGPVDSHCRCHWCGEFSTTGPHAPDCPWLSMPKIVAALEAAERIVQSAPPLIPHDEYPDGVHVDPDLYQALVSALRSEEPA